MGGKPRKPENAWMPPRVYPGKYRFEYRPVGGPTINLTKFPADGLLTESIKAQVWADYARAKEAPPSVNDIAKLMAAYHASPQFSKLSANTQKDYMQYSKRIGRVFGHMMPPDVRPLHIRNFMDAMGAIDREVTANRHLSYLSKLLGWGCEREWCQSNPAKLISRFTEKARDRYIEPWEYDFVLSIARASAYPYLAPMMEVAYLCRARSIEVRGLTEANIKEDGLYLRRTKGSISEITGWSLRLQTAISEARGLFPDAPVSIQRPIFHSRNGSPIPAESFKTAWGRVMREALKQGLKERFTFHDIKAAGVSDHETKASGHRTKKAAAVYDRKPGIVSPTR